MQIGSEVKYVRSHPQDGIVQGTGRIKAYGLDGEDRVIALVQDASQRDANGKPVVFNTPIRAINPTPEFVEAFSTLAARVKQIEDDNNATIRAIVENANDEIRKLNNEVLGEPLDMEDDNDTPKEAEKLD